MMLNIKNLFKKVCMLSVAATMAVGLGASFAEAEEPGAGTTGVEVGSVLINKAAGTELTVDIPLSDTLTFDGTAKQLILASNGTKTLNVKSNLETITFFGTNSTVDLWLRVADDINTPPTKSDWIKYEEASTLMNAKLTRTDAGTYYVFYYVDGKTNYSDITGA